MSLPDQRRRRLQTVFQHPQHSGQIPPRRPRPRPERPIDHHPVIRQPTASPGRAIWQNRLQPRPLGIGQIMTIKHAAEQPDLPDKIHGTRP
jgi:hypothetical protein